MFKKRLNKNMHRSIVLATSGQLWIYEYLFAKSDRDNIKGDELEDFRTLAKSYASLSDTQLERLLEDGHLKEICLGEQT